MLRVWKTLLALYWQQCFSLSGIKWHDRITAIESLVQSLVLVQLIQWPVHKWQFLLKYLKLNLDNLMTIRSILCRTISFRQAEGTGLHVWFWLRLHKYAYIDTFGYTANLLHTQSFKMKHVQEHRHLKSYMALILHQHPSLPSKIACLPRQKTWLLSSLAQSVLSALYLV